MITDEDAYIPSQDLSQDSMQAQFVNPAFWVSKYQKLLTNIFLDTLFSTTVAQFFGSLVPKSVPRFDKKFSLIM